MLLIVALSSGIHFARAHAANTHKFIDFLGFEVVGLVFLERGSSV